MQLLEKNWNNRSLLTTWLKNPHFSVQLNLMTMNTHRKDKWNNIQTKTINKTRDRTFKPTLENTHKALMLLCKLNP